MIFVINESIKKLVCYGLSKNLFAKEDEIFVTNRILEILNVDSFDCNEAFTDINLEENDYEIKKETENLTEALKDLESLKIVDYYGLSFENFLLYTYAKHNLNSFPKGQLAQIINCHIS
mgnify:CR=1 FL=1